MGDNQQLFRPEALASRQLSLGRVLLIQPLRNYLLTLLLIVIFIVVISVVLGP